MFKAEPDGCINLSGRKGVELRENRNGLAKIETSAEKEAEGLA